MVQVSPAKFCTFIGGDCPPNHSKSKHGISGLVSTRLFFAPWVSDWHSQSQTKSETETMHSIIPIVL
jgi:hypothetical protein